MKRYIVEIANTPEARERGLMDRTTMPMSDGMLFLFNGPTDEAFWNARTFLPLDLLLFDERGALMQRIEMQSILESGGRPTQYKPRAPYAAALEVVRGRARGVTRLVVYPTVIWGSRRAIDLF